MQFRCWFHLLTDFISSVMQDLLDPSTSRDMVIRETSTGDTFVEGLCRVAVKDAATAMALFDEGGRHRAQAGEGRNGQSSRSHVIALVYVERRCAEGALCNPRGVLTQVRLLLENYMIGNSAWSPRWLTSLSSTLVSLNGTVDVRSLIGQLVPENRLVV